MRGGGWVGDVCTLFVWVSFGGFSLWEPTCVCTVCIWHCEHTRFCVEVLCTIYIHVHSFTQSPLSQLLALTLWDPADWATTSSPPEGRWKINWLAWAEVCLAVLFSPPDSQWSVTTLILFLHRNLTVWVCIFSSAHFHLGCFLLMNQSGLTLLYCSSCRCFSSGNLLQGVQQPSLSKRTHSNRSSKNRNSNNGSSSIGVGCFLLMSQNGLTFLYFQQL